MTLCLGTKVQTLYMALFQCWWEFPCVRNASFAACIWGRDWH